jgi:hypothetical protein
VVDAVENGNVRAPPPWSLDNNPVENAIRPLKLGARN